MFRFFAGIYDGFPKRSSGSLSCPLAHPVTHEKVTPLWFIVVGVGIGIAIAVAIGFCI